MRINWYSVLLKSFPFVAVGLLYLVGVNGEFQFDDYRWLHAPVYFGENPYIPGRPVASFFWRGLYEVFGINPFVYRAFGLIVHLFVIYTLLKINNHWLVWAFAVHPVLVSTVAYPVQCSVMLATICMGWSFIAYRARRYVVAAVLCAVGCGCKQIVFMFPAVLFLYEWLVVRKKTIAVPLLAMSVACLYIACTHDLYDMWINRGFSPWGRLCTQAFLAPKYIGMVLLPRLSAYTIDHDVAPILNPVYLFMVVGLLLVLLPRFGFPVLGLACLLVPEFTILNLEMIFEHRLYAPLAFLVCCAPPHRRHESVKYIMAWLVLVNIQYQLVFKTHLELWEHTARVYPKNFRAHLNLAKAYKVSNPLKSLYHLGELSGCDDRKNGIWRAEIVDTYPRFYRRRIQKRIEEFNEWIRLKN